MSSLFPNYLLAYPGESFVWDVSDDALVSVLFQGPSDGALNGTPVSELDRLEYGKKYTYQGSDLLVVEYYLKSGSPWAVLLNEQYAAPLPSSLHVQRLRRRTSRLTINGKVLFSWTISGKPVYVQLDWEDLDPLAASVGIVVIATSQGNLQTLTLPAKERLVLLAGPPEVQATLSEGRTSMHWYAAGKVQEYDPVALD
ncbi:hypothetical protein P74p96 [Thermus phage P74-26]|uniref:Uncharacterized protein n=1 Tax=Thermus phage P74-26 TaxID=2914007 RepID=A7XXS6_BP742|nr:hypothetical protein P74p96 [Thermus phage P74-26]ABU97046.1 hypothetical protein P74p96 [Thermus phage P74-26]